MSCEGNTKTGRMTKIFRVRDSLVGFSGAADCAMALLRWFENGANPEEWPSPHGEEGLEASMMVVSPEGRVMFYERFPVPLIMEQDYFAIGSGRDFALAAMELGCTAEQAVDVASRLDAYTGGGITALRLDGAEP